MSAESNITPLNLDSPTPVLNFNLLTLEFSILILPTPPSILTVLAFIYDILEFPTPKFKSTSSAYQKDVPLLEYRLSLPNLD
jgi:hypothetical protein